MSGPLYHVRQWAELFETCETRKLKTLDWWPKRNKHDGLSFRRLVANRNRITLYCAWNLICDVASKTTPKEKRGILERDGLPLTAEDLACMTGFPEEIFTQAFTFFSSPEIAWLEQLEASTNDAHTEAGAERDYTAGVPPKEKPSFPAIPGDVPETPGGNPAEGKEGTEGNVGADASAPAAHPENEEQQWLEDLKASEAYRGIDVAREHAKMLVWCKNHRKHPTKRRFISWLNRCDTPLLPTNGDGHRKRVYSPNI